MKSMYSPICDAVEAIASGGIAIVVDSEDREDEGDFVAAAELITPQLIHFMISEGRGQLCVPILPRVAQRLELSLMVQDIHGDLLPRFAVPVDHRNCRSGISPVERAYGIRALVNPESRPDDFVKPGHIFPLIARTEGVLSRTGHTEAAVDLTLLAGLSPAGVLCEICSNDGKTMAKRQELSELARRFAMPIVTIDDLIEYRQNGESHSWGKAMRAECQGAMLESSAP